MSNPFFLLANPKTTILGLPSHVVVNRSKQPTTTGVLPSHSELPQDLHIFVTSGHCYDQAGMTLPIGKQQRLVIPPNLFDELNSPWVKFILTLLHEGVMPTVDISCCSWIDTHELPINTVYFLEFTMTRGGTVRFSDYSLNVAKSFLSRVGLSWDYDISPTLNGNVKLLFNPANLKATKLVDLSILADLGMSGEAIVHAMSGTRKILVKGDMPGYVNPVISLEDGTPALVVIQRPATEGRVILFSCHFCEITQIHNVDPDRVASAIRLLEGEQAAKEFLERIANVRKTHGFGAGGDAECELATSNRVARMMSGAPSSTVRF